MLVLFIDIIGIIKFIFLFNRVGLDKSESRSLVGDLFRWRKNVYSVEKIIKIFEVSEKLFSNGIIDEGENVNLNFVVVEK